MAKWIMQFHNWIFSFFNSKKLNWKPEENSQKVFCLSTVTTVRLRLLGKLYKRLSKLTDVTDNIYFSITAMDIRRRGIRVNVIRHFCDVIFIPTVLDCEKNPLLVYYLWVRVYLFSKAKLGQGSLTEGEGSIQLTSMY